MDSNGKATAVHKFYSLGEGKQERESDTQQEKLKALWPCLLKTDFKF